MKKKRSYYYDKKKHILKGDYPIVDGKSKPLHRWIAEEKVIGRRLIQGEVVHHVEGDKLNFHPKNLAVMSKDSHDKIERRLRKERNLNKANMFVFGIALIVFIQKNNPIDSGWGWVLFFLLLCGLLISLYSNVADWFIRKTKLYKFLDDAAP